jgi:coenzyme F420-0:L-glutamate ligase/coenzyme F420-1:gamma-L-glutamate ligase
VSAVQVEAVPGLPEIRQGDDLAALISSRAPSLSERDVVVIAHKVVSKAEGRVRHVGDVEASPRAVELAALLGKEDPRPVQVVVDESTSIIRAARGVLITRTHHGFVCANAGVDASNAAADGELILLPLDPDASARALRAALPNRPAVVITDSFGRAWRHGQTDVAIGVAGLEAMDDWRGRADSVGRDLRATWIAVADEVAAAADLVRTKDSREPVVVVRGLSHWITQDDGPGARAIVRPVEEDLFG